METVQNYETSESKFEEYLTDEHSQHSVLEIAEMETSWVR